MNENSKELKYCTTRKVIFRMKLEDKSIQIAWMAFWALVIGSLMHSARLFAEGKPIPISQAMGLVLVSGFAGSISGVILTTYVHLDPVLSIACISYTGGQGFLSLISKLLEAAITKRAQSEAPPADSSPADKTGTEIGEKP
jgi:hypothetical protein